MKFSHQHGPSALKIEMELPNDAHIYEVAEAFKKFLLCCGYEQGSIDEIMLGEQGPYIRVPVSGWYECNDEKLFLTEGVLIRCGL